MKKILGAALLLSLAATGSFAQGFYSRLGLGFAFPQAGQTLDGYGQPYSGTYNSATLRYDIKSASFSSGLNGLLGFGYLFNSHIGVELNALAGLSNKEYSYTEAGYNYGGVPSDVTIKQHAKSLLILNPSVLLQTGAVPVNFYMRMGLAVPVNTTITQDQIVINQPGTGVRTVYDFTLDIKNSFSMGFTAAAGASYKLNDRMSLWGEISLLSLSQYVRQAEVVAVSVNGQGQSLSNIQGSLITNYSKSVVADTNGDNRASYSQPYSHIGITVGMSFNLSNDRHSGNSKLKGGNGEIDPNKPFRRR